MKKDPKGSFFRYKTAVEKKLAAICSQVLDIDQIGMGDNFFELGGHSLTATQVAARVSDIFNIVLPLNTIFNTLTLVDLAGVIETQMRESQASDEAS